MSDEPNETYWCLCSYEDECDGGSKVTGRKCKWMSVNINQVPPFLKVIDGDKE